MYLISSKSMWEEINRDFSSKGGIYFLKCAGEPAEAKNPIVVNRLLKPDLNGVLYIGKATSFLKRVADLKKSISPEYASSSHECGVRYKSNTSIVEKFPFEKLYVELVFSENPRETELQSILNYEIEFGELPPLNRSS